MSNTIEDTKALVNIIPVFSHVSNWNWSENLLWNSFSVQNGNPYKFFTFDNFLCIKNIGAGYLNRLETEVLYIFGKEHFDLVK